MKVYVLRIDHGYEEPVFLDIYRNESDLLEGYPKAIKLENCDSLLGGGHTGFTYFEYSVIE